MLPTNSVKCQSQYLKTESTVCLQSPRSFLSRKKHYLQCTQTKKQLFARSTSVANTLKFLTVAGFKKNIFRFSKLFSIVNHNLKIIYFWSSLGKHVDTCTSDSLTLVTPKNTAQWEKEELKKSYLHIHKLNSLTVRYKGLTSSEP